MNTSTRHLLHYCLLCAFFLTLGCTQTIVPLSYEPVAVQSPACRGKLTVHPFADTRAQTRTIGTTSNGYSFYPEQFVEDWFTQALVQQIRACGCQADFAPGVESPGNPVVNGRIRQVLLREIAKTKYEAALKLTVALKQQGKTIHKETFSVHLEKTVLPRSDNPQKIAREAMQELMREVAPKLLRAANRISS